MPSSLYHDVLAFIQSEPHYPEYGNETPADDLAGQFVEGTNPANEEAIAQREAELASVLAQLVRDGRIVEIKHEHHVAYLPAAEK